MSLLTSPYSPATPKNSLHLCKSQDHPTVAEDGVSTRRYAAALDCVANYKFNVCTVYVTPQIVYGLNSVTFDYCKVYCSIGARAGNWVS